MRISEKTMVDKKNKTAESSFTDEEKATDIRARIAKNKETIMIDGNIYCLTRKELDEWIKRDPEFFDLSSPYYGKHKEDREKSRSERIRKRLENI